MPASIYKETTHKTRRRFTQKELKTVQLLSRYGLTPDRIGPVLDLSGSYFEDLIKRDVTLQRAIELGRSEAHKEAHQWLYNRAFKEEFGKYSSQGSLLETHKGDLDAAKTWFKVVGITRDAPAIEVHQKSVEGTKDKPIDVTPVEIGTRVEKVLRCVGDELNRTDS